MTGYFLLALVVWVAFMAAGGLMAVVCLLLWAAIRLVRRLARTARRRLLPVLTVALDAEGATP